MEEKKQRTIEPLLTVEELAAVLKVPRSWIYRMTRLKKIPVIKAGKYCRFRLSRVLEHLEQ
ncbi:MAG: helix-turn-helix domain-containing protein [Desulfobacterales bacterium]|nr:helix-turn-helix domain-containing protein [Desulfobacterales bacterium]